jgi:hypothetical protein
MRIKFIAEDGSLFGSEEDCLAYEEAFAKVKEKKKEYEEDLREYYKKYGSGCSLLSLSFLGK